LQLRGNLPGWISIQSTMQTQAIRLRGIAVAAAVTATYLVVGAYVNLPVREALKRAVGGHVPYWLDHIAFMLLADLVVATLLAWKLVGLGQTHLRRPTDQRAWLVGGAAGVLIVPFIGAALAAVGALKLMFEPNFLLMIGNVFSNFYEEYIFRGTLLAILMKYLGNKSVAITLSALVFCQGHLHFPLPLLLVVFLSALLWGAMVLRYRSLWPAWLSHCVMDFISDSIFQV
jgi:membrane protease YdiL (CAAX protease family)